LSYCRWSSDDFQCDLYCYEDCAGGFTTHVAANRPVGDIPRTPGWSMDAMNAPGWAEEMAAASKRQHEFLMSCQRQPIPLAHAGETFNDPTLLAFLARVMMLKGLGYRAVCRGFAMRFYDGEF
jgi:hypothetical protein